MTGPGLAPPAPPGAEAAGEDRAGRHDERDAGAPSPDARWRGSTSASSTSCVAWGASGAGSAAIPRCGGARCRWTPTSAASPIPRTSGRPASGVSCPSQSGRLPALRGDERGRRGAAVAALDASATTCGACCSDPLCGARRSRASGCASWWRCRCSRPTRSPRSPTARKRCSRSSSSAARAGLSYSLPIAATIAFLMLAVGVSYRQTIRAYPHGGGSYIVASDNLGRVPGLVAAAGLMTDYILTVAVSVASGIAAITSAIPSLASDTVADRGGRDRGAARRQPARRAPGRRAVRRADISCSSSRCSCSSPSA